jgi:hypothetical protein
MARTIKARGVCAGAISLCIGASAVMAQLALPATKAAPDVTVRPPVARQIEPMVSPIKRAAPKAAPIVSAPQLVGTAVQKTPPVAPAALASAQPLAAAPKIMVYTCLIGQDYSAKLKACFTPGVTKIGSAAKAIKAKVSTEIENARKSALGAAKRKS